MDIQEFRKTYGDVVKKVADIDCQKFNVFKVLGLTNYEIRHSNFLAWLLKSEDFRKKFIEACDIKLGSTNEKVSIQRETHFREENEKGEPVSYIYLSKIKKSFRKEGDEIRQIIKKKQENKIKLEYIPLDETDNVWNIFKKQIGEGFQKKNNRYIDLNIIGDNYTITIENKVDSGEHDYQCVAYRNYMKKMYGEDKGYTHNYFIYLAKEKPTEFDKLNDADGLYPEYRFISYEKVLKILNELDKSKFDDIQKEIIKQYKEIIEEWKVLPQEYVNVIEGCDITLILENDAGKKLLENSKDELSEEEERFLALVNTYYLQMKKRVDEEIKPILINMLRNQEMLFETYNGNYAKALPLSELVLSDYSQKVACLKEDGIDKEECLTELNSALEKLEIIKTEVSKDKVKEKKEKEKLANEIENEIENKKDDIDKAIKNELWERIRKWMFPRVETPEGKIEALRVRGWFKRLCNEYEKSDCSEERRQELMSKFDEKINAEVNDIYKKLITKNTPFQTIDYRAPMGKYKEVTMAIIVGIKTDYSKNLCEILRDKLNGNKNMDVLFNNSLSRGSWDKVFKYYCKNGSGYKKVSEVEINKEKFKSITKKIFDELTMWEEINEKKGCYKSIGSLSASDFFSTEYQNNWLYLSENLNDTEIAKFLGDMLNYYIYDNEKIEDSAEVISTFFNNMDNASYKKNYSNWLTKEPEKQKKPIKAPKISKTFLDKIETYKDIWSKQNNRYAKLINDLNNDMTELKKQLEYIVRIENFNLWKESYLKGLENKGFKKEEKKKLNMDSRTHKELIFGWELDLIYKVDQNGDELLSQFYNATLDGLQVLGYDNIFEKLMLKKELSAMRYTKE